VIALSTLQHKVALLWPHLDERARRLFAATEARQLGHGAHSSHRDHFVQRIVITRSSDRDRSEATFGTSALSGSFE